jgi:hypothetical protein
MISGSPGLALTYCFASAPAPRLSVRPTVATNNSLHPLLFRLYIPELSDCTGLEINHFLDSDLLVYGKLFIYVLL